MVFGVGFGVQITRELWAGHSQEVDQSRMSFPKARKTSLLHRGLIEYLPSW